MQSTPTLGALITEEVDRDAIHIAVLPVVAGDYLNPGQWAGFHPWDRDNVVIADNSDDAIGVVDPFLKETVKRGQKFWLLLFPNTITSLRHEWVHPKVPPNPSKQTKMSVSEAWLREFAFDYGVDYYEMMGEVADAVKSGGCDSIMTLGSSSDVDYETFWEHYQIVTGTVLDHEVTKDMWFRCAC